MDSIRLCVVLHCIARVVFSCLALHSFRALSMLLALKQALKEHKARVVEMRQAELKAKRKAVQEAKGQKAAKRCIHFLSCFVPH